MMVRVTQAHIDAREDSIVESALGLFARKGSERTTMQDIATDAGLSAGAIYRYFPGKEKLLEAVFEHCIDEQRAVFAAHASGAISPLKALIGIGRYVVTESLGDPMRALDVEITLAAKRDPDAMRAALIRCVVGLLRFVPKAGKRFFFEKKKQKTFYPFGIPGRWRVRVGSNGYWLRRSPRATK